MIKGIDLTDMACWWLVFRAIHGASYMAGITYLRTLAWFGASGSSNNYGSSNHLIYIKDI
jgi:uncharacterized MAPEG superfamily protein